MFVDAANVVFNVVWVVGVALFVDDGYAVFNAVGPVGVFGE